MKKEELYAHFKELAISRPDLERYHENKHICEEWMSRLLALVEFEGDPHRIARMRNLARDIAFQIGTQRTARIMEVGSILQQCLAKLEYLVAPEHRGAFVHADKPLDAHVAIHQVLTLASKSLLIVDPYLDQRIIVDYLQSVKARTLIQLLTDKATYRSDLVSVYQKWKKQHLEDRPIELRLAAERTLHDRIVIGDSSSVWLVTQSFKDFASRSPASILKAGADIAQSKISAYKSIWDNAEVID